MYRRLVLLALARVVIGVLPCPAQDALPAVEDIFGRRLTAKNGAVLVDWEGYIANPAIELFIVPPANVSFPAKMVLTSSAPRLYFNSPSETGSSGARKEISLGRAGKQSVLVSIFPDRDDKDENYDIGIELRDKRGRTWQRKLPVRVIDQDRKDEGGFPVTIDFSHDRTGFFQDEKIREIVVRAARDWMYFFDPTGLDPVPAGVERTFVRSPDDFLKGDWTMNAQPYTGVLLYASGIRTSALRSGGAPSDQGGFQSVHGKPLQIRRSGSAEFELRGNYNQKGWLVRPDDTTWWKATNLDTSQNDFYSVVHHEFGHALFFNSANPLFARAKNGDLPDDKALVGYFGSMPKPDKKDHFPDQIDPASRRGLFGNEFSGEMPLGRWLPTKGDLLFAQAIGYRLRPTSAFAPLVLETNKLPPAKAGVRYSVRLQASGGIPFYNWDVAGGRKLPAGLRLDSFTGELYGITAKPGNLEVAVRVRDYQKNEKGVEKTLTLEVKP